VFVVVVVISVVYLRLIYIYAAELRMSLGSVLGLIACLVLLVGQSWYNCCTNFTRCQVSNGGGKYDLEELSYVRLTKYENKSLEVGGNWEMVGQWLVLRLLCYARPASHPSAGRLGMLSNPPDSMQYQ